LEREGGGSGTLGKRIAGRVKVTQKGGREKTVGGNREKGGSHSVKRSIKEIIPGVISRERAGTKYRDHGARRSVISPKGGIWEKRERTRPFRLNES